MPQVPIPVEPAPKPRVLGTAKGEFVVPADFNEPLQDDVMAQFECPNERKTKSGPPLREFVHYAQKIAKRKGFQPLTDAEIKSAINEGRR
jgi:hypothetical protein